MENYQLYRTNLLLGGQMKWDIVLDSDGSSVYVSDFHLTPISPNIPYTSYAEENLLGYKHQDNVKKYFKTIGGYFYNDGLNAEFQHNWPIITKPTDTQTPVIYSDIYDMGCRRAKNYKLYNKQFELFCPVWLEHIDGGFVSIKIIVRAKNTENVIGTRVLRFYENQYKTHNDFVRYFTDYATDCGLYEGNDSLMYIDLTGHKTLVNGLSAKDGIIVTRENLHLTRNLVSRERPLMESDSMIIDTFVSNNMICKQLFNFNFCFNLEDLISSEVTRLVLGDEINITAEVIVNGETLERRDFYTEYDFIPRERYSTFDDGKEYNVFEHLNDNNCLSLIPKNKFAQNVCHWSLCDNNDYIFNLYRGFEGYYVDQITDNTDPDNPKTDIYMYDNEHHYGRTPSLTALQYDKYTNAVGWINWKELENWSDLYAYLIDTMTMKLDGAFFEGGSKGVTYVNGVKYNKRYTGRGFYVLGAVTLGKHVASMATLDKTIDLSDEELGVSLVVYVKSDFVYLITDNKNTLTFANMFNNLRRGSELGKVTGVLNDLYEYMSSKLDPKIISFNGLLNWDYVAGPTNTVSEIEYFKDNNKTDYVLRYDGRIKPTFIKEPGYTLYYKDFVSDVLSVNTSNLKNSLYAKYINSKFEPIYPSIGYSSIKKLKDWTYDTMPNVLVTEHGDTPIPMCYPLEYKWFDAGHIIHVTPYIYFEASNRINSDGTYKSIYEITYDYIKQRFNVTDEVCKYVLSKYDICVDWEYTKLFNINEYHYKIELKLK